MQEKNYYSSSLTKTPIPTARINVPLSPWSHYPPVQSPRYVCLPYRHGTNHPSQSQLCNESFLQSCCKGRQAGRLGREERLGRKDQRVNKLGNGHRGWVEEWVTKQSQRSNEEIGKQRLVLSRGSGGPTQPGNKIGVVNKIYNRCFLGLCYSLVLFYALQSTIATLQCHFIQPLSLSLFIWGRQQSYL